VVFEYVSGQYSRIVIDSVMEFFYFFGDGVGMSVNRGGRGVTRMREINLSAAESGTWLPRHGGAVVFLCLDFKC
jgi:hypothetical protein